MMSAVELADQALAWLKNNYANHTFFTERDIVWTVQTYLNEQGEKLGYQIYSDFPIEKGTRRSLCADLAILADKTVEIALEFKYEPAHSRKNIWQSKFKPSVVFWNGEHSVAADVKRIKRFVEKDQAKAACSIFIDEGGFFRQKPPHPGSEWQDWGNVAVLIARRGK